MTDEMLDESQRQGQSLTSERASEEPGRRVYREPICPFCYAFRHIKAPMTFDFRTGVWQCPYGNHTAANLDDSSEEAIRKDLIDMMMTPEDQFNRMKYLHALTGPPKRKGGGSKSGRKVKKDQPRRPHELPGTLA